MTGGSMVSALMSMQFTKMFNRIVPKSGDMGVHRYNVYLGSATLASYYDSAIFFASYPEASYGHIGEDGINDPTFSGRLVCLNNGAIIDESGIVYDAPLVPLFGMDTSQGPTLQEFLVKFYADIKTDDMQQSEFSNTNVEKTGVRSEDGKKVINALIRQFDISCIDTESRFGAPCVSAMHQRSSLLATTLQNMQEGLYLTAAGKIATLADATLLQKDYDAGALGNVAPIQGYGKDFMTFLKNTFPNTDVTKFDLSSFSGVLGAQSIADQDRLVTGKVATAATQEMSVFGAQQWNYPAYGLYVYTCYNTPFAREYKYITGINTYDLIIFLNEKLQVVPFMAPVIDQATGLLNLGINPEAKLFTSLLAYDKSEFQLDDGKGAKVPPVFAVQDSTILGGVKAGMAVNIPGVKQAVDAYKKGMDQVVPNSNIGNQVSLIEQAIMHEYRQAPELRPYDIVPVDDSMNITKDSTTIVVYQGIGCYPLPMGDFGVAQDYLVPFYQDPKGNTTTVQLPNKDVNILVSLVTDVVYSVTAISQTSVTGVGQSYILKPVAFTGQFDATTALTLDTTKPQFATLQRFTSAGMTAPDALQAALQASYAAWAAWLQKAANSFVNNSKEQIYGIPFGDGLLQIISVTDFANQNYMYSFVPSYSNVADDVYVVADSTTVAQNSTVGLKATGANKYIVSLTTGVMYDVTGQQVVDASGKNVVFDTSALLNMVLRNQKTAYGAKAVGMSPYTRDLLSKLQKSAQASVSVDGPFVYGLLRLCMYHSDAVGQNYLFFTQDASGQINNYFVAVDAKGGIGGPVTSTTQAVVSLITGTQYTASGQSGVWPDVKTLLSTVQKTVHISGKDLTAITTMAQQFQSDSAKADADSQAAQTAQDALTKARLTYEATLPAIAAKMSSLPYLPVPYDSLKQDPQTGMYYYVQTLPNNSYLITDFDAFNMQIATFDQKGQVQMYHDGHAADSMLEHCGIAIDAKGNQTLTVPQEVIVLDFSDKDKAIKPGQSGDQLLACTDPAFPLKGLAPLSVGPVQYTFYYFTPLSLYLVYVYDSVANSGYYLNISDGSQYDQTGLPIFAQNAVAIDASKNLLFPTQDADGMLTVMLPNPAAGNAMTEYDNQPSAFTTKLAADGSTVGVNTLQSDTNTILVLQAPLTMGTTYNEKATTYSVYYNPADQTKVSQFQINSDYTYYALDYIPVDPAKGTVVQNPLGKSYATAKMILNKGAAIGFVYNGKIYSVSKTSGNTFMCVAADKTSITVQQKTDAFQNLYVVVQDGIQNVTYRYEYAKKSSVQMQGYMQATWKIAMTLGQNMDQLLVYLLNVKGLKSAQPGSSIMYEAAHDRYVAALTKGQYSSVDQDSYADLSNGALFDRTGASLGHSMFRIDFAQLLQDVGYVVRYDSTTGKNKLVGSGAAQTTGSNILAAGAGPQGPANAALGGPAALGLPALGSSKIPSSSAPVGAPAQNTGIVPPGKIGMQSPGAISDSLGSGGPGLGMTPPPSSVLAA
jgi:hypothetical protein